MGNVFLRLKFDFLKYIFQVIGFIYGYITEQFGWTVYIVMAGFALSCLVRMFFPQTKKYMHYLIWINC